MLGEPTGGRPNSYGDSRKLKLPNSGLTVRISTLYWQSSSPSDERPSIAPHLPAELSSRDYIEGRDPALESVFAFWGGTTTEDSLAGTWSGPMSVGPGRYDLSLAFNHPAGNALTGTMTAADLNITKVPLRNLTLQVKQLSFGLSTEELTLGVRATAGRNHIAGYVLIEGQAFMFILKR